MARTAAVGAPLRHPAFQRLWLGLSISYLGDEFTIIALLWFVHTPVPFDPGGVRSPPVSPFLLQKAAVDP